MFTKFLKGQRLFVRDGAVVDDKMWLWSVEGPGRGKDGDAGLTARRNRCSSEESERGQIMETSCVPMRRLFTQTDVDWLSGMCQEAWMDSDIPEIMFMLQRLLCTVTFTRCSAGRRPFLC